MGLRRGSIGHPNYDVNFDVNFDTNFDVNLDVNLDVNVNANTHFDNFSVTVANMISEGDQVATQLDATADGMEAKFGHFHKVEAGKIKEFWIYDDSQKMAHTMKAV